MATVTVAASNARQPNRADLRCAGVNDHMTINSALSMLPSGGGKVLLSEGVFYVTDRILLYSNTILEGHGSGTVIKLPASHGSRIIGMIRGDGYATPQSNITVKNLVVDGSDLQLSTIGISFNRVNYARLDNVEIKNCRGGSSYGLLVDGGSTGLTVIGSQFHDCENNVIEIKASPSAVFVGNQFYNGKMEFYCSSPNSQISLFGNLMDNSSITTTPDGGEIGTFVIANNIWKSDGAKQSNLMWFRDVNHLILSGNLIDASGITLATLPFIHVESSVIGFQISANVVKTGDNSSTSRAYGAILAEGGDGLIANNTIYLKSDENIGVKSTSATNLRVQQNKLVADAGSTGSVGVDVAGTTDADISGNTISDAGVGVRVAASSTGTVVLDNRYLACGTDLDNSDTTATVRTI